MDHEEIMQGLQAFTEDPQLKQLEEALTRFNLFDAIGATHKELWHSDFLAFLLDPGKNHGLNDNFARAFLTHTRVLPELDDGESFEHIDVRREYQYIDILIIDEVRGYVIIVENKIWSGETGSQLQSYWDVVQAEYPTLEIRGIFLTPTGRRGSDPRYLPLSYKDIAGMLTNITPAEDENIPTDVRMAVGHYVDMLRRFIVGSAGTDELARQIYLRHRQAIEKLKPITWQRWINSYAEDLIKEENSLFVPDKLELLYIRFGLHEWDAAPLLRTAIGWTDSARIVLFQFDNFPTSLNLRLYIGPGNEDVRQSLCELCRQHKPLFLEPTKVATRWWQVYEAKFLVGSDYEVCSDDDRLALEAYELDCIPADIGALLCVTLLSQTTLLLI